MLGVTHISQLATEQVCFREGKGIQDGSLIVAIKLGVQAEQAKALKLQSKQFCHLQVHIPVVGLTT